MIKLVVLYDFSIDTTDIKSRVAESAQGSTVLKYSSLAYKVFLGLHKRQAGSVDRKIEEVCKFVDCTVLE